MPLTENAANVRAKLYAAGRATAARLAAATGLPLVDVYAALVELSDKDEVRLMNRRTRHWKPRSH